MDLVEKIITVWKASLCEKIELAGLISRNEIAHKWKVTYRSIVIRELTFWRVTDLLSQVNTLAKSGGYLGARILFRSAIETIGILIYLNQKTSLILENKESFHKFSEMTTQLMLGSKNKTTSYEAINVTHTILEKWCEKKYPGLFNIYSDLCESAHPNFEGVCFGYSDIDESEFSTCFSNRWDTLYKKGFEELIIEIMQIFEHEYNEVWPNNFDRLEKWIEINDQKLEQERISNK